MKWVNGGINKAAWRLDGPLSRRVDGVDVTPGERWGEEKEMFYDYLPTRWRKRFLWADVITRRRKITINLLNINGWHYDRAMNCCHMHSGVCTCVHTLLHTSRYTFHSFFLTDTFTRARIHTHMLTEEMFWNNPSLVAHKHACTRVDTQTHAISTSHRKKKWEEDKKKRALWC